MTPDPDPVPLTATELRRFTAKIAVQPNGCWHWTGALNTNRYGCLGLRKVPWLAHRLMYLLTTGGLTPGLTIDHTCHQWNDYGCPGGKRCLHRRCVNPAHLEEVTGLVNTRRSAAGRFWRYRLAA